jgi:hypothetical protein
LPATTTGRGQATATSDSKCSALEELAMSDDTMETGLFLVGKESTTMSTPTAASVADRRSADNAVIDGIRCDPAPADRVYTSPAGTDCYTGDGTRRFDEVLYQNTDGYWFLVRPLAPDEARDWLGDWRHDSIHADQLFPND